MWNPRNGPPGYDPSRPDSRHRDIIRQEAKMDEMAEEITRQEERSRQEYLKSQGRLDPSRPESRHADMIRHESEMVEEVKRQEEHSRQEYLKNQAPFDSHQNRYPPQRPPPPDQQMHRPPPPAGPKPQQRPAYPQQQGFHPLPPGMSLAEYEHMKSNQMYRESPPPPPPPSNTHPLAQQKPPFNPHENHDIHNRLPQHPNMGPPMR